MKSIEKHGFVYFNLRVLKPQTERRKIPNRTVAKRVPKSSDIDFKTLKVHYVPRKFCKCRLPVTHRLSLCL
jgi:hypothetical protein